MDTWPLRYHMIVCLVVDRLGAVDMHACIIYKMPRPFCRHMHAERVVAILTTNHFSVVHGIGTRVRVDH